MSTIHPSISSRSALRTGLTLGVCVLVTGVLYARLSASGPFDAAGVDQAGTAPVEQQAAEGRARDIPAAAHDMPMVRVRDSSTGRALGARLQLRSQAAATVPQDVPVRAAGQRLEGLSQGDYSLVAEAPGYLPLETHLSVGGQPALPMTLWLSPRRPSLALDMQALAALECGYCSLVGGHVYDRRSGRPLSGARVRSSTGERTVTDADGRFELLLAAPVDTLVDSEALPTTVDITIDGDGYRTQQLVGVPLLNDSAHYIVDLAPGQGRAREDLTHVQVRARQAPAELAAERAAPSQAEREKALDPGDPERARVAAELAVQAASVPVPASIRVGMNCSGRVCSSVSVYGFEDYVARGLDDEWIASWNPDALAAGAVAYRSYAAWFVANPVNSSYDICSSTSCQVFRAGSHAATVAAAQATRGVVLTRDGGTAAFSEYSSENNAWDDPGDGLRCNNPDLSCGNGYNGSPANGWPCLADEVGRGRGCFGHGRGMSQWGTQRWAANHGRDWRWIANHYYNANDRPAGMRNAFLANLTDGTARVLDDFEAGVGHFYTSPTYSGSTVGISTASTATHDCNIRRNGNCSLRVLLKDNPNSSANWAVRLLSGAGTPGNNVSLSRANGRIGFWVYSGGSGMSVGVGIDDSDGTERSVSRAIPANQWTYVEWSLTDSAQWNAWAGGNGAITAGTVTLDAIWLYRAPTRFDVNIYIDDVQIRN